MPRARTRTSGGRHALALATLAAQLLTVAPAWAAPVPPTMEVARAMFNEETDLHTLAERGDPEAQYSLGTMYAYGMGQKKDLAAGRMWLERAAAQGHAWSQYELARLLERGDGGPADPAQALSWYRQAAAQGEGRAALRAGRLLRLGDGVPQDLAEAERWLTVAARQNVAEAQLALAVLLAADEAAGKRDAAIAWLERAATQAPFGRLLLADMRARSRDGKPTTPSAMGADWASRADQPRTEAALKHALAPRYGIGESADEGEARRRLERLVGQGNVAAMTYLAEMTAEGLGGAEDPKAADALYRRAATLGDGPAQVAMARVEAMDDDKALAWLRKAAAQGLPEAQAALGMTLEGEDETDREGRAWLLKAAQQGHAEAAYRLTSDRGSGFYIGEEQRSEAQMKWLRFAAEQGVTQAQLDLGRSLLEEELPEGRAWLERAAQRDNNAALALADAHRDGQGGPKDVVAASRWYMRAYALGDANGLFRHFMLLHGPEAGSLPHAELLPMMRREAEKGSAFGQYLLGRMHHLGLGLPRDPAQALRLYTLAANGNFESAQAAIGLMHAEGDGVPRDDAAAIAWLQKAIANDSAQAKIYLARMLRDGRGAPKDVARAVTLLEEAGYRGRGEGYHELGIMHERGLGVPVDLAKAKSYYERAASNQWPAARARLKDFVTVGGQLRVVEGARYWEDLRRRAEKGEPAAQLELGSKLLEPTDGTRELEAGLAWVTRAASQGHAPAQLALSRLLVHGFQVPRGGRGDDWVTVHRDPKAALDWLRRAAEGGSVEAQVEMARHFHYDLHGDKAEAFRWALAAAEGGNGETQLLVAGMYARGAGTAASREQAIAWAEAAIKQGLVGGYTTIADVHRRGVGTAPDPALAFIWTLKGAQAGDHDAMYEVAEAFAAGVGVPKDLGQAAAWYAKAARPYDSGRGGFAAAKIYLNGPVGVKHEALAHLWYLTGIQHWCEGDDGTEIFGQDGFGWFAQRYGSLPAAQYALAKRLETGDGLPRDLAGARDWYRRAADFDDEYPQVALMAHLKLVTLLAPDQEERQTHADAARALLRQPIDNPFDFVPDLDENWEFDHRFPQALKALHEAAKQGYAPAQFQLGTLLSQGRGVPRNEALGLQWLARAAEGGYTPARLVLYSTRPIDEVARRVLAEGAQPLAPTGPSSAEPKRPAAYERAIGHLQAAAQAGKVGPFTPKPDRVARFVSYIIDDEPLSPDELKSLAKRTGMSIAHAEFFWATGRLEVKARMSRTPAERAKWLLEAAALGSVSAMRDLAEAYSSGKGVAKDPVEAVKWDTLARAQGADSWDDERLAKTFTARQLADGRAAAMGVWARRHKLQLAP